MIENIQELRPEFFGQTIFLQNDLVLLSDIDTLSDLFPNWWNSIAFWLIIYNDLENIPRQGEIWSACNISMIGINCESFVKITRSDLLVLLVVGASYYDMDCEYIQYIQLYWQMSILVFWMY